MHHKITTMKRFNWKKVLLFLVMMGGIYYISGCSLAISLGVLLLLVVADALLWEWDENRKIKKRKEAEGQ